MEKICVKYNRNKYYKAITTNCQHFFREILNAIKSDFNFEGEFRKTIMKLETEGKVDFIFNGRIFKKKIELDRYVK